MITFLLTLLIAYTAQVVACAIIHVINNTKTFPEESSDLAFKYLNIFWVLFHIRKL